MALSERAPLPESDGYEREMLGFCNEMGQQANLTVSSCEGYSKIIPTMQAIMGVHPYAVELQRSQTWSNEVGRVAEIMHAHLTDTKPSPSFRTFNSQYETDAVNMGKMWTAWYYKNAIDMKYGMVIDYAIAGASGYGHQLWNKAAGDIDVVAYDGRDVRPVDPFDVTVQSCYGLFIDRAVPLSWAQAQYPHLARDLERDAVWEFPTKLPETTRDQLLRAKAPMAPFDRARPDMEPKEQRGRGIRVVHLNWFYFNDPSINDSNEAVLVGDFDRDGEPITNYSYKAHPGDPRWPRKRLVIHSRSALCYDGPNHYWHGMFPVSKFTVLPWPWTWLGGTPLWDCIGLQHSLNFALRVADDHVRKLIRPPISGDRHTSMEELKRISQIIAQPGAFWKESAPNGIKVNEVQPLDPAVWELIRFCLGKIPERAGIDDLSDLRGLKQMPEGDTLDKLLFATAPASRLRSRMMELFYREQGRMFMFNSAQFKNTREHFQVLGPKGMSPTYYDFDPKTWIPVKQGDTREPVEIATEYFNQIDFYIEPSSLLRSASAQKRAEAMGLFRLGALDIETLLEELDYPNVTEIMKRLQEMWAIKMQLAAAAGGQAGGNDQIVPQRPLGGDQRGRKTNPQGGPQQLRGNGNIESGR